MSEVKVNKITPTTNCGTVTLGDSGDTLAIPCGVTLSNAGSITNSGTITNTGTISGGTITGTIDNQVNWDTTAKTSGFTAVAGNGYFVNTTSGAITVTLPATPSAGDLVGIKDYAGTAATNNITIDRNGSNIQGTANNFIINTEGLAITLIYVDGTQGWVSTGASKASDITQQPTFTVATGGTITTCGNYKIHTFTSPGTFCVSSLGNGPTNPLGGPTSVDYLVVAGGGGGAGFVGGGGGAGGFRESHSTPVSGCYTASPLATPTGITLTATAYPITVGSGGAGWPFACSPSPGTSGSNSIFSTITSAGGGAGAGGPGVPALSGGSGGGNSGYGTPSPSLAGSGNTPPVSPPQGNPGGSNTTAPGVPYGAGGGGGAGSAGPGIPGGGNEGAPGGAGVATLINPATGEPSGGTQYYAGGGGGSTYGVTSPGGGTGGLGGGGDAINPGVSPLAPGNGSTNTGGGGGGTGETPATVNAGNGGSGIVIIRYKYQ